MHNDYLLKYKIGFGALGFLTLIGLIMLLAQSGAVRHDNKIYKQANEIATKLNRYTDTNGKAPGRLEYIGVDDIPEDITYTKLATDKYKFCVNYERKSSNISTSYRLY